MDEITEPFGTKVCGTVDLMLVYCEGKKLDLDEQLADSVAIELDPNGNHVLTMVLLDHRADAARNLPTHHRASVILKIRDSCRPFCTLIDVTDEQWRRLVSFAERNDHLDEAGRVKPQLVEQPEEATR